MSNFPVEMLVFLHHRKQHVKFSLRNAVIFGSRTSTCQGKLNILFSMMQKLQYFECETLQFDVHDAKITTLLSIMHKYQYFVRKA